MLETILIRLFKNYTKYQLAIIFENYSVNMDRKLKQALNFFKEA